MTIQWMLKTLVGFRFDEDAHVHVAYAPALSIYSQGRTREEATMAIESAISLYICAHYERGTLTNALTNGVDFELVRATQNMPYDQDEFVALGAYSQTDDLEVPMILRRNPGHALATAAC
ncbi:MAG TPA: hypothetical protein VK914_04270 [bacterium]|jgi:hypothetical protein|nr:hypothetical protein [bacterium]